MLREKAAVGVVAVKPSVERRVQEASNWHTGVSVSVLERKDNPQPVEDKWSFRL